MLSEYLTSTPVTPDSFIHKVHYQVNGDEADDTQEDHETTEEEHLDSNNDVDLEGDEQDQPNDGVQTDYEEELETDDEAPSQETEPHSNEEGLNDEQQDGEESSEEEDSGSEESTDQADGDTAESLEDESEDDQEDDADESEEGELLFGDSSAVESKPEIKRTGRSSQTARTPELPADKVLSGVLGSGGELFQSIADLPHDSFDGNKDSKRKIRNGRQQEQASVAVLTQLRDELYKTYAKYMGYQQARGTSLIPREKQLEIQHQLAQLSQLIAKVDTLIKSSRESEHNMYQQEKIASIREYRQAAALAPPGVEVVPAPVQPSLIRSDINYYSKEIALTIATAPLGGIVFRLAGKGLKALKALRAARAEKLTKGSGLASSEGRFGARSVGAAELPKPGRMHKSQGKFTGGQSYTDFEVLGRSVPEIFADRMIEGSKTLSIDWTGTLGFPALVRRIKKVQELCGGPGTINLIKGQASDNFQRLIARGAFNADEFASLVGKQLGGTWKVELLPVRNSIPKTWEVIVKRIGD